MMVSALRSLLCCAVLSIGMSASHSSSLVADAKASPTLAEATRRDLDARPAAALPIGLERARPVRRPDGKKWRLGYVDSGDYSEYPRTLKGIVQGLEDLGWLSIPDIPSYLSSEQLWAFIAQHTHSDYIEFVADAWWQPGYAEAPLRPALRQAIISRLSTADDIDLIIAMGTWAAQDMVSLGAPVPTIVASTSDPIGSRIVPSQYDSGLNNLHARVDPERYQRQIKLFHEIIPFKRLGLVYENSAEGEAYSGLRAVKQVAKEAGFELVPCYAASNGVARSEATKNVIDCYRQLATEIDAAYITVHRGVTTDSIKAIAEILSEANVPSFSMLGSTEVQQGILLGLAQADACYVGMFYAETIAQVLNGATPRQLDQIWIEPAKLAINLDTARRIGFDPPVDTLLAADEIFPESLVDSN